MCAASLPRRHLRKSGHCFGLGWTIFILPRPWRYVVYYHCFASLRASSCRLSHTTQECIQILNSCLVLPGIRVAICAFACHTRQGWWRVLERVAQGVDGAVGFCVAQSLLGHTMDGPCQPTRQAGQEWQDITQCLQPTCCTACNISPLHCCCLSHAYPDMRVCITPLSVLMRM